MQSKIIETYTAGRLMHLGDEQGGQVSLIDHRGVVGFRLDYHVACIAGLGRCATQITSWRSLYAGVKGLANRVLDGFLLVQFDSIVSDARRTKDTERFWRIQLSGGNHDPDYRPHRRRRHPSVFPRGRRGRMVCNCTAGGPLPLHLQSYVALGPGTVDDADTLPYVELADMTDRQQEIMAAGQIVAGRFP